MIDVLVSAGGEIVTLAEAKRQLSVWDSADDANVASYLAAARAYCEEWGELTLRVNVTRRLSCETWPDGDGWVLKRPPVVGVTSVKYLDAEGAEVPVDSSNYRTHATGGGLMLVEFIESFVRPATASRRDAVSVTYTTGFSSAEAAPDGAKAAILLLLSFLYDARDQKATLPRQTQQAAMSLLSAYGAPSYL